MVVDFDFLGVGGCGVRSRFIFRNRTLLGSYLLFSRLNIGEQAHRRGAGRPFWN